MPPQDSAAGEVDVESAAREICLRLLERRAYSRAELVTRMTRRGIPDDVVDAVLDRFTEVGLIDDRALAAAVTRSQQASRGLARRAVAAELKRRGIGDEAISETIATIDPTAEAASARALVQTRLRSLGGVDEVTAARRLVAMLARRGYPPGVATGVVREALAASGQRNPAGLDQYRSI